MNGSREVFNAEKSYDDAIKKIWDYIRSDDFMYEIATKLPQLYLSTIIVAERGVIGREAIEKEKKKYDDLLTRLRIAERVLRDHGAFEEYQETWMGKEKK